MRKTLRINDNWELSRDAHAWELRHWVDAISRKDGEPTRTCRRTWHPSMDSAFDRILDVEAGQCEELDAVRRTLYAVRNDIKRALRHLQITVA